MYTGLANTKDRLYRMREIELKHSRIAMLASVGWPMSELFHDPLAEFLRIYNPYVSATIDTFPLANGGQAPTVLNGGLMNGPNAASLGIFTLLFSIFEYYAFTNQNKSIKTKVDKLYRREPGDFGFDPLALYEFNGPNPAAKLARRNMEISNGRMAMVAMLIFLALELCTGKPVVELTPIFFKPIWEIIDFTF
jgi:hypothetical protein